jgi:hypothetical protein
VPADRFVAGGPGTRRSGAASPRARRAPSPPVPRGRGAGSRLLAYLSWASD